MKGRGTAALFNDCEVKFEKEKINKIFNAIYSNTALKEIKIDVTIEQCCITLLRTLTIKDPTDFCYNTAVNRSLWIKKLGF